LTGNCRVDVFDMFLFAEQWLDSSGSADFDGMSGVDLADFAVLAGDWGTGNRKTTVVINEFMADNDEFIQDPQGEYDDWMEIHNYGLDSIDIGGMYLTDELSSDPATWWEVPNDVPGATTIEPGGFLLIWADEDSGAGLHADFKLSASGEDIGLFDIDRISKIDSISFGPQGGDDSLGRFPDAAPNWRVFSTETGSPPTPGSSNQIQMPEVVINEIMYHPTHGQFEPEPVGREFVELYNAGAETVDMTGWQFTDGIDFNFPADTNLAPQGYLVVAADVNAFSAVYASVTNVIGGWVGKLRNSGEKIVLADANGKQVDEVHYYDEGDWAERMLGPLDHNERGWEWSNAHDGDGNSLELINPLMPNEHGQNWAASAAGPTPGAVNSAGAADIAPLIADIEQSLFIPTSSDTVVVTAAIVDELTSGLSVSLRYRVDGQPSFSATAMFDDGAHGDGHAGDGVYGAQLAAEPNGTIMEFYIQTTDAAANTRTCPAPADVDGTPEQVTNLLYLVDDSFDPNWQGGRQPVYYIIMTDAEFQHLQDIGDTNFTPEIREYRTDAQMNATFISVDGTDTKLRYNVGVRNRGQGTRRTPPMNYRVNFRHDETWKDITEINFNTEYTYLQQVGSQIFRLAGLPAASSAAIQVCVNGRNLSIDGERMYHTYTRLEVINDDFADNHFGGDGDGNVYKCAPLGYSASLEYLGTNPLDYNDDGYFKQSNEADNDWNDLFELTNIIQNEPDATFVSEMRRVADAEQWLRWFAVHSLIDNNETNLGIGYGDDYYMYRGDVDTRFLLVPHDLDTVLGLGDEPVTTDYSIFRAADGWYLRNTIDRFLRHPVFAWRYYKIFEELIETVFDPNEIAVLFQNAASDYVPAQTIAQIRDHVAVRNAQVLAQLAAIPRQLTVNSDLPVVNGYHRTTGSVTSVYGIASPLTTRSVLVNGQGATWSDNDDEWQTGSTVALNPGINRIIVETFDRPAGDGNQLECAHIDIWYDDGDMNTLSGSIPGPNMVLDAASGPWHITGDVTVPAGVTLFIEPGTTLFFDAGCGITVSGRLVAEGTKYERIRLTKVPGGASSWDGLAFVNSLNDSRLRYADMEYGDAQGQAILVSNSQLLLDNVTWAGAANTILELSHPSVIARDCILPDVVDIEPVHGGDLTGGEYLIFERNTFGTTTGYRDIIDFSNCTLPGPILQVYDNVFLGGQDDGLDLDNADAYVEGNIFMNFVGGTATSTSNAIATDLNSEIAVLRNIFVNNDHAVLLKGYASIRAEHNVFVGCGVAVINFQEDEMVDPGDSAFLEGNIFWDVNEMFQNDYGASPTIVMNYCMAPNDVHYLGTGNIDADPMFVDEQSDLHLRSGSPATGAGPNGSDMGVYVQQGASVSGEPDGNTYRTTATLTVGGPDVVAYEYRVKDNDTYGGWSSETDVAVPIELSGLSNGHCYTVYVKGKNSLGNWPGEPNGNASETWVVDTGYSRLRVNEILAHTHGAAPDLIELFYDGPSAISLVDKSMTDDPCEPRKFVFGSIAMNPGDYIVLYGDANTGPDHLGFALNSFGDGLYLYDSIANGGVLIDSVEFGQQINDFTIARFAGDRWHLAEPTLGSANTEQPLANPRKLKINEWLANGEMLYQDDFVELYSPSLLPASLGGLYITDKFVTRPDKHRIADLSFVEPNGYAVFIADDDETTGPSHLNFKLSSEGEIIGLFDADLTEIDKVIYGPQTTDVSQGRSPDGSEYYGFFATPTPEQANPNVPHPQLPPSAFDSVSSAGSSTAGATLSWSHTIGSGSNRLLTVGLEAETTSADVANLTVQSVRFNGIDLTKAGDELITTGSYSLGAELWYLLEASVAAAGTYTVEVTYSGIVRARAGGAISIAGAVQAAPEDVATSTATDNPISSTVTASAGAWVIDAVGCGDDTGNFTTQSSGGLKRYQAQGSPGEPLYGCVGAGSTTTASAAGPVTVEWNCSSVNRMAQVAASFAMLP